VCLLMCCFRGVATSDNAGTRERIECSRLGNCDETTGICRCAAGLISSDGDFGVGDRYVCDTVPAPHNTHRNLTSRHLDLFVSQRRLQRSQRVGDRVLRPVVRQEEYIAVAIVVGPQPMQCNSCSLLLFVCCIPSVSPVQSLFICIVTGFTVLKLKLLHQNN
jgi:hypothetical protein